VIANVKQIPLGGPLAVHVLRDHLLIGGLAAAGMVPILGYDGAAVFLMATVFVDLDHHWMFVWRSGFQNFFRLRKWMNYHRLVFESAKGKDFLGIDPLHTLEFLLLLAAIAANHRSRLLDSILLGCTLHLVTDAIHLLRHRRQFVRVYSFTEYVIRRRILLNRGIAPDRPFVEAINRLSEI
jgi:hypothetical protein